MAQVFPGRYIARIDGPLVIFMVGMRINQPWAVHKWMPVAAAMPPMQVALRKNPAEGLLGPGKLGTVAGSNECGVLAEFPRPGEFCPQSF